MQQDGQCMNGRTDEALQVLQNVAAECGEQLFAKLDVVDFRDVDRKKPHGPQLAALKYSLRVYGLRDSQNGIMRKIVEIGKIGWLM